MDFDGLSKAILGIGLEAPSPLKLSSLLAEVRGESFVYVSAEKVMLRLGGALSFFDDGLVGTGMFS